MLFACRTATDMACSIFPKEIREDEKNFKLIQNIVNQS
jgi:hypothetical protein